MSSQYPAQIDNSITLPTAVDNLTPVTGITVNRLREAIIRVQTELGIKPSLLHGTVRARLDVLENTIGFPFMANGDLSGTTSNQTVIGLQGNSVKPGALGAMQDGYVLTWNDINKLWEPDFVTAGSINLFGDVTGIANSNHVVKINGNAVSGTVLGPSQNGYVLTWVDGAGQYQAQPAAISFTAGGDLSGTNTLQTVIGLQGISVSNTVPTSNQVLEYNSGTLKWTPATLPASFPPNGAAGGDLSGSYPDPAVAKVNGTSVPSAPNTNQVIIATSSTTSVWGQISDAQVAGAASIAVSKLASGTSAQILQNNGTPTPTWTTISGDVSITNSGITTVNKIDGASVPSAGSLITGNILQVTGSSTLSYSAINLAGGTNYVSGLLPASNQAAQTMAGDVTGTTAASVVSKIDGASVPAAGSLITGNVLQVTGPATLSYAAINLAGGANFVTGALPTANQVSQAMLGDVTGTTAASVVSKIDGASVPAAGSLITGNVLQVSGSSALSYAALNLAGGANFVTGSLPVGNQESQTMSGNVTGTTASSVVVALQGNAVQAGALGSLQDGYVLAWTNGSSQWQARPTSSTIVAGQDYSFSNTSSDISGYFQLFDNATGSQQTLTGSSSSSSKTLIKAFATIAANPDVDLIPAGIWEFNFWAFASLTGAFTTTLVFDVYTRTSGGAETLLFSATSGNIQVTSAQSYTLLYNYQSDTIIIPTTRLVIKVSAVSSNVIATTVSFIFDGTTQASLVRTPLAGAALQLGGDLSGTTSTATVIALQGNPVMPGALGVTQDGYVLSWKNIDNQWEALPLTSGSVTLGGDVTGAANVNTVVKIQGNTVTSGALTKGQFFVASSSSNWAAVTLSGDISESGATAGLLTVININGSSVPTGGSLTTGNVLQVTGASTLSYAAINLAGGTNFVTGLLPSSNQSAQTMSGDVTGTTSSNTVISITGSAGSVNIASTGNILTWNTATTAPGIKQSDKTTNSGTGATLTIQAQNETGTTSTGGGLTLTSGTGTTAAGALLLQTGGTTRLTANATGVITIANLGTGVLHADGSGNLTSSTIVNADISAAAAIAVSKLAAGTSGQILQNNGTPTPTWTTVSGDISITNAGVVTVTALQGNAVQSGTLGASQDGYVLTWHNASSQWQALVSTGSGGGGTALVKTTTYIMSSTDGDIFADLSSAGWTLTLPSSPTLGDKHTIKDYNGNAGTTVSGTVASISGSGSTVTLTGGANFTAAMVGLNITIFNATSSLGNNGIFPIASFISSSSITYTNASTTSGADTSNGSISWSVNGYYNLIINGNGKNIEQFGGVTAPASTLVLNQNYDAVTLEYNSISWSIV